MKPSDPSRRTAILERLAEIQPASLKELTKALDEDYTFVVRTMGKYKSADAVHRGSWEIHHSKRVALWVVGPGEDVKPPKAIVRSKTYLRTYHREYYHRIRKQRTAPSGRFTYALAALMNLGGQAA